MPPTKEVSLADLFLKCFEDHELFFAILAAQDLAALSKVLEDRHLPLSPDSLTYLANRLRNPADKDELASITNTAAWEAWKLAREKGPWNPTPPEK